MSKKAWAAGLIAVFAAVGSCTGGGEPTALPSSVPTVAPRVTAPITPARPPTVIVTRVIDGETVEIAGGQRVRVLGIDACAPGTDGGRQARESAEIQLDGAEVVLTQEPGVDRDDAGRLLRYVASEYGSDIGESFVVASHTRVDEQSRASEPRLDRLRQRDVGERTCTEPTYAPSTSAPDVDIDVDDDGNLPDGALTGGYCARKWWC